MMWGTSEKSVIKGISSGCIANFLVQIFLKEFTLRWSPMTNDEYDSSFHSFTIYVYDLALIWTCTPAGEA